jgi:hypothetical protein
MDKAEIALQIAGSRIARGRRQQAASNPSEQSAGIISRVCHCGVVRNLTRKAGGRTRTVHLRPGQELEKARREVAEHRHENDHQRSGKNQECGSFEHRGCTRQQGQWSRERLPEWLEYSGAKPVVRADPSSSTDAAAHSIRIR